MRVFELNEVFVERELESRDVDGQTGYVKLQIGKPQLLEQVEGAAGMWCCLRQITGIGDEKVRPSFGIDSLQALLHSLESAEAELEVLGKQEHKTLTWLGGNDLLKKSPSDVAS